MGMATFKASLHPMIYLGTVEVVVYPANQYLPFGMVRRDAGMPSLPCGPIPLNILVERLYTINFWSVSIIGYSFIM